MEKKRESGEILEHMLLEEVKIENINFISPPEEWKQEHHQKEPFVPPVLILEKDPSKASVTGPSADGKETEDTKEGDSLPEYTLLAHHRSFWKVHSKGQYIVRAIVVRSNVHISLAHESIKNCIEEALLFDGLLRNELCENRSRLSDLLGYSRARITQILNLLKLPFEMRRKLLLTDEISEFQLRPIVRVSSVRDQREMFQHLIKGKLTGRQMALFADEKETVADGTGELPDLEELMREEEEPVAVSGGGGETDQAHAEMDTVANGSSEKESEAIEGGSGTGREDSEGSASAGGLDAGKNDLPVPEGLSNTDEAVGKGGTSMDRTEGGEISAMQGSDLGKPVLKGSMDSGLRKLRPLLEMMKLRRKLWEEEAEKAGISGTDLEFLNAVAKLRNGLYGEAIDQLERVVGENPDYAPAYFYMGKCHNLQGELDAAENALRTAIDLVPGEPDYLIELAIVLEKMKRDSEASAFYRRAGSIRRRTGSSGESS